MLTHVTLSIAILFLSIINCFSQITLNAQNETEIDSAIIVKLENDWANAMVAHDQSVFNNLLADDFIYTENEKMYSRAEVMQTLMADSVTVEKAYNEGMQVHFKEQVAIVTGWLFTSGKGADTAFNRKYRFTDIWFNKNNNWQLIAAQDYLLP